MKKKKQSEADLISQLPKGSRDMITNAKLLARKRYIQRSKESKKTSKKVFGVIAVLGLAVLFVHPPAGLFLFLAGIGCAAVSHFGSDYPEDNPYIDF